VAARRGKGGTSEGSCGRGRVLAAESGRGGHKAYPSVGGRKRIRCRSTSIDPIPEMGARLRPPPAAPATERRGKRPFRSRDSDQDLAIRDRAMKRPRAGAADVDV